MNDLNQPPDPSVIVFGIILVLIGISAVLYAWLQFVSFVRTIPGKFLSSVSVNPQPAPVADGQTDEADRPSVSAVSPPASRLEVDRTRSAIIDTLLLSGWGVAEIRAVIKGDNNTISNEVAEARKRLTIAPESRTLAVRDHTGRREILL
jgi:hypothetical protein